MNARFISFYLYLGIEFFETNIMKLTTIEICGFCKKPLKENERNKVYFENTGLDIKIPFCTKKCKKKWRQNSPSITD